MASIFERQRLRPAQLRTVAERRYADARYLCDSGLNRHANGAIYLAGFVIECLLKARLPAKHPWLERHVDLQGRSREERRLWRLCYQRHALDEILARLPEIHEQISRSPEGAATGLADVLKSVCGRWTMFARYSPKSADISGAREMLDQVKELKEWLK